MRRGAYPEIGRRIKLSQGMEGVEPGIHAPAANKKGPPIGATLCVSLDPISGLDWPRH